MVFPDTFPTGDAQTQVPSTLWLPHHQHVASTFAGEEHGILMWEVFIG